MRELCDPKSQQGAKFSFTEPGIADDAAMVKAFTGLCVGIVMIRMLSVITMCLPWRTI